MSKNKKKGAKLMSLNTVLVNIMIDIKLKFIDGRYTRNNRKNV